MTADAAASAGRHRGRAHRNGARRVASTTGKALAALLSLFLLVAAGYLDYSYNSLNNGLHRVAVGGLGHPAPPTDAGGERVSGVAQNLLLIGSDSRSGLSRAEVHKLHVGASDPTTSTDTLLIVHVPADGSRATLISIPRDSYVDIPGHPRNKINAAYIDGYLYGTRGYPVTATSTENQRQAAGITLLVHTIKDLTGLSIDHYAMVSFLGFYNIAKAIHGIDVTLCHAVNDTTAYNMAQGNGPVGSGFHESAGAHHLDPVQSLQFVRQRHNLVDARGRQLNDEGREARQRYFLAAAFSAVESAGTLLDPGRLGRLLDAVKSTLILDGSLSLPDLAHQMLDLTGGNIVGNTIPTKGSRTFPAPVGDALVVDPAAVHAQIAAWLDPRRAQPTTGSSRPSATTSPTTSPTRTPSLSRAQPKGCID